MDYILVKGASLMKKRWIGAALALASAAGAGAFFTNKVMYIKKKTEEQILESEQRSTHFSREEYEEAEKEHFSVPSSFGYDIYGTIIAPHPENKFMIFCHGVTVNSLTSFKYMKLFLNEGWNVVSYDHRRHGKSGGKTTSYGFYEKQDLKTVVEMVKAKFGEHIRLGVHGESMGAVTTLLYASMKESRADFYIADCPFSDFKQQLVHRLKEDFKLPPFPIIPLANFVLKWRDGYRLTDISPLNKIEKIKEPVLFIHSAEDTYILPQMTKELYRKKQGEKMLFIAPHGTHARSLVDNYEHYEETVRSFLTKFHLQ
jgi:uncharacterized protein